MRPHDNSERRRAVMDSRSDLLPRRAPLAAPPPVIRTLSATHPRRRRRPDPLHAPARPSPSVVPVHLNMSILVGGQFHSAATPLHPTVAHPPAPALSFPSSAPSFFPVWRTTKGALRCAAPRFSPANVAGLGESFMLGLSYPTEAVLSKNSCRNRIFLRLRHS